MSYSYAYLSMLAQQTVQAAGGGGGGGGGVSQSALDAAIAKIVGAAPATLDTLAEIDAQLAADEGSAAALAATVGGKASLSALAPVALSGSALDLTNLPPSAAIGTDVDGAPVLIVNPADETAPGTRLSSGFAHLRADPAPGARYPIKTGNAQEPSVWRGGGKFHLLYNLSGAVYYTSCTDTADPRLAANWTAGVQAFTVGHGVAHASLYVEGATAYYYFTDGADQRIYVATASTADLTTWTVRSTAVAEPIGNLTTKVTGNSFVLKDGATYVMFAEGGNSETDAVGAFFPWEMYVGTSSSPLGPFTFGAAELETPKPGGAGSVSGAWVTREDGLWVMWFHGQAWGRSGTPTDIYRAVNSGTITADTWTITNGGRPVFSRAHPLEVDQVADAELATGPTGIPYLFYTGIDNTTGSFNLMVTQLYPTRIQSTPYGWRNAEPLGGGEAPQWNAFVPRATQNAPHLDPTGQARVGTWGLVTTPAGMYGGVARTNTSAASGDYLDFDVMLTPGAYSFSLLHPKGPDQGIVTVDLAYGSRFYNLPVGTIDQYAATESPNNRTALAFTIGGTAPAMGRIRLRTISKNASSTGFRIADQGWSLTRTDR